jgi:DNA polymerase I-like protein with 3'-5' exonuclease and polymerase domains
MIDFPGSMAALPYQQHTCYLASDLIGTRALYEHLIDRLNSNHQLREYYDRLGAPLTPLLVAMTEYGFRADLDGINAERARVDAIRTEIETRHPIEHGASIASNADTARWLWTGLRLRPLPGHKVRDSRGRWVPSLRSAHLKELAQLHRANPKVAGSLAIVSAHRKALDLRAKLGGLLQAVESDGRIHTKLVDRQATGRVTSSSPNLQAISKETIVGTIYPSFRPRNALVADPGYTLVAMDLAQADIRVLAHAVATFPTAHKDHLQVLRQRRLERLIEMEAWFQSLYALLPAYKNLQYRAPAKIDTIEFDPLEGSGLARAFNDGAADFYTVAATAMLGTPPKDKKERNFCKQTILGIVNGMGPGSLARRLKCDVETAKDYQAKFEAAYPNEIAYRRLMVAQITATGQITTFMGRDRVDTAHHWLVTQPRVKIKISYKRSDRYWLDVTPLAPKARVLTCYIHRAWDAKPGRYEGALVYDAARGCTTRRDYRLYDHTFLEYRLPIRNIAWRSIRRVRALGEEAQYRGLDAVTRALFNAVCQGGTADMTKLMMLGSGQLCEQFGARLQLQIHDELVYTVPRDRACEFIGTAVPFLQGLITGFKVPIVLEPKFGARFGALEWRDTLAIVSLRPPGFPRRPSRVCNNLGVDAYI